MGKRKYDNASSETSKKKKVSDNLEENLQNVTEAEQPQNVGNNDHRIKNARFDIKHFRKELAEKQGQTMVLTQFLQVCLNPDNDVDYLLEYLKVGGNSHEILRQVTQDNKKNLTLATPAFHLFHLIIVKVQSSLPHMISITEEACRYFLNTFIPTVEIMISENSGPRHRKIILNLLTSMVTLNSDLGVEVLNQVPLTPKHLQYIAEKPNYKEKDNVRTAFVHFMTSFLVDGNLPLIKALLEKQGLLPLVIPGLVQDEPEAVLMLLNILKKNVIDNTLITKTLKLKTFSHQVLHNLFKVFMWKGPPELNADLRNEARSEIMGLLSDIMLTLFTSHRLGLYFVDKALGTSDVNKNQNLYKAILSLKRPWENEKQCEVILQIMYKCPDLHRAIINIVEQSFQPLHSPIWEKATTFILQLLDKMQPEDMAIRFSTLSSVQITNFIRFVTLPVPLLRHIQASIGDDVTISLYGIRVLVKMLQTLKRYMKILENEESNDNITELKNKLDNFLPKHVPSPAVIVGLIKNVINEEETSETTQEYRLPTLHITESLLSLIDLLLLYNYIHPAYFESLEGNLDMIKILDYSMTLTDGRTALLKFKIVSLWLTLDNTIMSLNNAMFKDLFQILLEVYTSDTDNTWLEAKDTLIVFFKNTGIFEADEDEIHLMLYTLRNAKVEPVSLIGDTVEYVLSNSKELAEYVKSQMVNFEVTCESSKDSLDKLFSDLMSNRCTGNSVFLESKIPSTYIVGCMQFILNQKEKKKHLKNFLSLYVANLLHFNYSPELTEVLIGDCKLDARSYVVAWTSEPVSVPEAFGKDTVLKNLSKSLLTTEMEPLLDIFPLLAIPNDENDIMIMNSNYRINTARSIDSSELFVWAKYIMFCIVRLTNMNQLTEFTLKKLISYFECIIILGRNYHMIPVCRNIVLNVLKNSHFLKIYTPLDINKCSSYILATQFIIKVITQHEDFIDYLNKKHFVLKSYQQKNYSEIMKAFVKVNKRKNLTTEHTMNVLETIGLSTEDDILVLKEIFNTKIETCVKDDKEPSLVLELLRMLIEKYSKKICSDLSQEQLKSALTLYIKLLTNKEIISNLTRLETAFVQYFESKPHQAVAITPEQFKQFFCASNIRRSTSQLAFTLLKNNATLCYVFKQELHRPEILGHRELTLPLGIALIDHDKFLSENKDLLLIVYTEYKSNILKFLEKPHKVGQIYILSWKFIRKLIVECLDIDDCKKLFAKNHKFEVAEASHVHLLQAVFLKACALNGKLNNEHLTNYFTNFLQIIIIAIKENKDILLEDIILNIYTVTQICRYLEGFSLDRKEEFSRFTESSVWQTFCKVILKDSLKVRTMDETNSTGPKLLCLLSKLIKLFYPDDSDDIVTLFDMVTSHSEFLNVMLSYHSPDIKSRLLELLFVLVSKNKSVMKPQQIPVYLSAFHATRSTSDRIITKILHFYESNGQPMNEYKPYVWGDSAANYYAVRKNRTSSLWGHPTPNQVMNLFDRDIIDMTIRKFPVNQKFEYDYELPNNLNLETGNSLVKIILERIQGNSNYEHANDNEGMIKSIELKPKRKNVMDQLKNVDLLSFSHLDSDKSIYDPLFLFPLMSHLLAPGSVASCFKMMRTGLLSVPVMALSSHCPQMRAAAYHVLHRFCLLLETETRHKNDKLLLTDFITTLRQSLTTAISVTNGDALRNPRLPAIGALYLAKTLVVSTSPSDPLYKPVNNFLIAKQFVDLTVVPDFLNLFHDSDVEFVDRRLWVLDIIRDGAKTMTDINVIFKTMCIKMIMDYYSTVISDRKTKEKIISAFNSIITIPRAFEILVEGYGLLPWLHSVVRIIKRDEKNVVKKVLCLLRNMIISMDLNLFEKHYAKQNVNSGKYVDVFADYRVKSDIEYEIISIAYYLLPHVENLEINDIIAYLEIYRLVTKRTLKFLTKKQLLNVITKCTNHMKKIEGVNVLVQSAISNNAVMLGSKIVDDSVLNGAFINVLRTLVNTYIT